MRMQGLTLSEALKIVGGAQPGRPIRRPTRVWTIPCSLGGIYPDTQTVPGSWMDPDFLLKSVSLTAEDILATDWEVRPE